MLFIPFFLFLLIYVYAIIENKKVEIIATKIEEFDKDSQKIIRRWFTTRSVSESTAQTYLSYLTQWLKYNGNTLSNIYEIAQKQQLDYIPLNQRTLTQLILDYKYFIDNSQYAQTTKNIKMNVIYSFCRAFEFEIPHIRLKKALCEDKNYERPITKQELITLMNSNPLRETAFLILQATSGMSSKEARNLTIFDIIKAINNELHTEYESVEDLLRNREKILEIKAYEIRIVRSKVNYRYITFLNNECLKHILNYIQFRFKQKNSKKLTGINKPLFITNRGEKMSSRAVTAMYREMGNKVGFTNVENTYRFWRSHNIRKYFYNIVEEIVGIEYADEWLGHVPNKVTMAYARREYRMKQAYLKCLPYLLLETDMEEFNKKIIDLEEEIKRLKEKYE